MMQFQGSDEMLLAEKIPGAKKMPFYRKIMGLIGFGKVTGIFRLFRLRFPTYIFADLPGDFGTISNHTGDQPYWGIWNFWPNEIEDLLPGENFKIEMIRHGKKTGRNLLKLILLINTRL